MMMKRLTMILGAVLLGADGTGIKAQAADPAVSRFEFSVMATDRMRDVGFAQLKAEARSKPSPLAADYEIVPMRITSQGRSDLYSYEGPMPLRIVETAPAAEGKGVRAVRMLGALTTQAVPPRALLLLSPDPIAEGDLAVMALDDSEAGFPPRHVRIVNLSGARVAGRIGDAEYATTETRNTVPPIAVGSNVSVGVAYERQGSPAVVFDQSIRVGEGERVLLVFLPPYRPGADVRVRVVRDSVRVVESEE